LADVWTDIRNVAESLGAPDRGERLVAALQAEKGRLAEDLHVALVRITGFAFGSSPNGWRVWYATNKDKIDQVTALTPIAAVAGLVCGLIVLEPDYGTAFTVLLIVAVMVFAAGLPYRQVFGLTLVMVPVLVAVLVSSDYRRRRLISFLDPWADPLGDGFQIIQSQIAVGTGGLFGQGLMGGVQKLFYLPDPHTDFIYAVIAEETGLLGATAVLLCFGVIVWRGLRITAAAPDRFGVLLALGLTMMVTFQAFVNISVVLGLMPTKGIPLPFVSSGGSSLLVSLLGMGILLNVSQHASADA